MFLSSLYFALLAKLKIWQTTETYSPQTFSVTAAVVAPAVVICLNSLMTNTTRQKQKYQANIKLLTAKTKSSRQNQKPQGKTKLCYGGSDFFVLSPYLLERKNKDRPARNPNVVFVVVLLTLMKSF